jgi:hypothetical protein
MHSPGGGAIIGTALIISADIMIIIHSTAPCLPFWLMYSEKTTKLHVFKVFNYLQFQPSVRLEPTSGKEAGAGWCACLLLCAPVCSPLNWAFGGLLGALGHVDAEALFEHEPHLWGCSGVTVVLQWCYSDVTGCVW